MRSTTLSLFILAGIANPVLAQNPIPVWFQRLDQDRDGKFSAQEFPYPLVFKRFDLDGDGTLSPAEAANIKATGQMPPVSPDAASTDGQKADSRFDLKTRLHDEDATQASLNPDVLAKLDVALQRAVEDREVAGVIGLIHRNGHRGYFEAFGWQDIEAQSRMPRDAIFRLKSMSKPVVTVAALVLFDDGKFGLDDPISNHLPQWKEPKVSEGDKLVPTRNH